MRRSVQGVLFFLGIGCLTLFLVFDYQQTTEGDTQMQTLRVGFARSPWLHWERQQGPGGFSMTNKLNVLSGSFLAGIAAFVFLIASTRVGRVDEGRAAEGTVRHLAAPECRSRKPSLFALGAMLIAGVAGSLVVSVAILPPSTPVELLGQSIARLFILAIAVVLIGLHFLWGSNRKRWIAENVEELKQG